MLIPALVAVLVGATPKVGDVAPDFSAVDTEGKAVKLSEWVKKGPVILAFFPKAFTPGCTKEIAAYRDKHGEAQKAQARVVAISSDDSETLKKFKTEMKAPFTFVPDPEAKLIGLYDVKMPAMSLASRTTFVVGGDMKVIQIQTGKDAVDPTGALAACSLKKKSSAGQTAQ